MGTEITRSALGKRVIYDGETVGRVVEYTNATAYVDRDPAIGTSIQAKLGATDAGDLWPLQRELVGETTDDEVRLAAPM